MWEEQIICIAFADLGKTISNELGKNLSNEQRSDMEELMRETAELVSEFDTLV